MDLENSAWQEAVEGFRAWLANHVVRQKHWERRFAHDDDAVVEGAVAEAAIWDVAIRELGADIENGEHPANGGPDFLCNTPAGQFYLEVKNISAENMREMLGLPERPQRVMHLASIHHSVKPIISDGLLKQLARRAIKDIPVVVGLTTFYSDGALAFSKSNIEDMMRGEVSLTARICRETGEQVGDLSATTEMEHTFFTKNLTTEPARENVSAVLFAGLGYHRAHLLGALHPCPNQVLPPECLHGIPLCAFPKWPLKEGDNVAPVWR